MKRFITFLKIHTVIYHYTLVYTNCIINADNTYMGKWSSFFFILIRTVDLHGFTASLFALVHLWILTSAWLVFCSSKGHSKHAQINKYHRQTKISVSNDQGIILWFESLVMMRSMLVKVELVTLVRHKMMGIPPLPRSSLI